ncbi:extracellular solute-binding protein, partial [Rhizobiaceae sp. 2RAB30]
MITEWMRTTVLGHFRFSSNRGNALSICSYAIPDAKPLRTFAGIALALGLTLPGTAFAGGELRMYNWGEYTNPKLVEKFEKETGITVTIDTYDSNETLLAKLKSGATGYDLIVPGDYMVAIMIREKLLEPIDPKQLPNFANVDERWRGPYWDPQNLYSIPWQWGTSSFQVDTKVVDGPYDSLALLFDPPEQLKGKINMMRDVNDVINMALRYLDLPRCNSNPDDLKKVAALLTTQKQWVRT